MNKIGFMMLTILAMAVRNQNFEDCEDCEFEGKYVCGSNGLTYPSGCHAECAGEDEYIEGICLKRCDCLDVFKPVCGFNGQTYRNACSAQCEGVKVFDINNACSCNCTNEKRPVCGNNQKTYLNECHAKCDNVGVTHLQACHEFPQIHSYPF